MIPVDLLFISIVVIAMGAILTIKVRAVFKVNAQEKRKAHQQAIKPSLSFFLKKSESMNADKSEIRILNTGKGPAIDIQIDDVYYPEEKNWFFKFQRIDLLDRGTEKSVEFDFFVGSYKASNKTDQMWMFDPDHDHDFAVQIVLSYYDIERNAYSQTITIGENKKNTKKKLQRLQLIQKAISSKRS